METSLRINDPEDVANKEDLTEESSNRLGFDWVDPKLTEFISVYRDSSFIGSFVDNHNLLKSDVASDILAIDYCRPIPFAWVGLP